MKILTRAKVNLSLEILGKLPSGYHNLRMIMQSVDIYDKISINLKEKGIIFECDNEQILSDNLAEKAARKFFEITGIRYGCEIYLEKKIPMGAGMAGGSVNAAGVLLALNRLCDYPLDKEELLSLGLSLGADVPFCMIGGTALAEGIGEKLTELPFLELDLLVVKPEKSISTKEVFAIIEKSDYSDGKKTAELKKSIVSSNNQAIFLNMVNGMYNKSLKFVPEMKNIIEELENKLACQKAMMSGSGSTVFGIFDNREDLKKAFDFYKNKYSQVYITKTANESVTIIED